MSEKNSNIFKTLWKRQNTGEVPDWRICFAYAALIFVLCLPGIIFNDIPMRDVALRYAPMADAFARGDFTYAFHPRIPMLFPVLSGVVSWLCGTDGFVSCKIASSLLMSLAVVPLLRVMGRLYTGKVVLTAGLLYAFTAPLLKLATEGLRDSGKLFSLMLIAEALLEIHRNRKKLYGYVIFAVAAAVAVLTRAEMLLFTGVLLAFVLKWEFAETKIPWRSLSLMGLLYLFLLPATIINGKLIGSAMPEFRFGMIFAWLLKCQPGVLDMTWVYWCGMLTMIVFVLIWRSLPRKVVIGGMIFAGVLFIAAAAVRLYYGREILTIGHIMEFFECIFSALYPDLLFFTILGFILRRNKSGLEKEEKIILYLILGHAFMVTAQVILFDGIITFTSRYLIVATPLGYGWTALGICAFVKWLNCQRERLMPAGFTAKAFTAMVVLLAVIAAGLSYVQMTKSIYRAYFNKKQSAERQMYLDFARIIKEDFKNLPKVERKAPQINKFMYVAHTPLKINFLAQFKDGYLPTEASFIILAYYVNGSYDPFGDWKRGADYYVSCRQAAFPAPVLHNVRKLAEYHTRIQGVPAVYELFGDKR